MSCPDCQHANPDGARFCNACGAALEVSCSACGRTNPPASRFCNGCGAALHGEPTTTEEPRDPRDYTPLHLAEKILKQKGTLEGERKHVTVLFADLANSTALAEAVGPEEMHALMDRAFQQILEPVHRYEGTVNQFMGDGVMALFGAPIALEDAPRRAVVAALDIHRALAPLDAEVRERHGRPFQMRIGIHTGPVVVGRIGDDLRMDYTAIGDTTNLAARLEQLATAGSVLISDTTRRLVDGFFDLIEREPSAVKGKSRPVTTHEVVAVRHVGSRIEAYSQTELTPYVGRSAEIESLLAAFRSAREGRGQVAFVVGEAGIGKSRLLHEFRQELGSRPHTWIEGRCASYARTTPFHPIADGMRRRIGIDDRDDEHAALAKVDALETDAGGGLEWTLPYLRQLLSLPSGDPEVDALDAMIRRSESCRALQSRFLRIAQSEPLVLVIEDLHWIDAASEEFLSFLADSIPAAPVLLIFTHRPGYVHPFGDRSFHVRILLQALSDAAMNTMVSAILEADELPLGLRELISRKAEGNPLFVEEVSRSLLEEGAISQAEGGLTLARDLADIEVPNRIQDVLMARLDRLEEEPKRAIQIASIIGREFALRLLERIAEVGKDIDGIVGELRALELILQKSSHPELAYMFKHALTHDVAYDSVLVHRRKALHRIVGVAIEELYADRLAEHYEALGHHFFEAGEWERSLHYHELAAQKSAAAYAHHAAADHCRAALQIIETLGDVVPRAQVFGLALRLAESSWNVSDFPASAEAYMMAADLSEDPATRSLLLARAGFSFLWNHDYEKSTSAANEGLALAREHGADAGHAFALVTEDEHELVLGRRLTDDSLIEEAIQRAERAGDPGVLISAVSQLGQRAEWRGEFDRAIQLTERAVDIAAREGMPSAALFGQWFLGIAATARGEYGRGLEVLMSGLELCDRIGDRAVKARLINTVGWCYAEFGCHERAAQFNRLGTDLAREMVDLGLVAGAPELYANAAVNLAGNLTALGDLDAAAEHIAPIQAELAAQGDPWQRWRYSLHVQDALARIELARGNPEGALTLCDEELAGARRCAGRKIEARALDLRGRALLVMDRRDEAERSLTEALQIATQIQHPPVAWRALSLLGEVQRRRGNRLEAAQRLAEARRLVDDIAPVVPDSALRREFRALGEQLATNPMDAYR